MPYLTTRLPDLFRSGPFIDVTITTSTAFMSAFKEDKSSNLPLTFKAKLLIDTGAACTAIDKKIAEALQLKPHGITEIRTPSTAGDKHECPVYDIDIVLSNHEFKFQNRKVIASDFSSQGIDGLFGRDLLRLCLFTYSGKDDSYTIAI